MRTESPEVPRPIWTFVDSNGTKILERNAFNSTTGVPELVFDLTSIPSKFPQGTYTVWIVDTYRSQMSNKVTVTV